MASLWEKLIEERKTLAQAPVLFVTLVVVSVGGTSLCFTPILSAVREQKAAVDERLKARDDQITQLQARVGASSPDEVMAKVRGLQSDLEGLKTKLGLTGRMTDQQKSRMRDAIVSAKSSRVQIMHDIQSPYAKAFSDDLFGVFSGAGWAVDAGNAAGLLPLSPSGISLNVANKLTMSAPQKAVAKALDAAGISYVVEEDGESEAPQIVVSTRRN